MPALKSHHTFALNSQCQTLITITDASQLANVDFQQAFCILGEGSNTLFIDDFEGTVVHINNKGVEVSQTPSHWLLACSAGEDWHQLVQYTLAHDMPGLENLALIPGTVGAAPVQNIGAYGVEVAQFIDHIKGFHIASKTMQTLSADECQFAYRDSIFKHQLKGEFVITEVGLKIPKQWQANLSYGPLQRLENPTAMQVCEEVIKVRQSKLPDPYQLANCGSFFKNPILPRAQVAKLLEQYPQLPCFDVDSEQQKVAAGWLIDQAGLKGKRIGDIAVHELQALVLVNHGTGTADELTQMINHIQHTIWEKYGIALEHEVRIIGAHGECHYEVSHESA